MDKEKAPMYMTKFDIVAGEMLALLDRFKRIEDTKIEGMLRGSIYQKAKDLVYAFEYGVDLEYGRQPLKAWNEYLSDITAVDDYDGEDDDKDFDDEDSGIAHACIRTAQIKSFDFSENGVTKINMRNGEPIIFKDISEVMFIS